MTNKNIKEFSNKELDIKDKKIIWASCISGSQIKDILFNPKKMLELKRAKKEKEFFVNDLIKSKMAMGNLMEDHILQIAKEKGIIGDYKTDKRTFFNEDEPRITCNIDAYMGEDINNIDTIIEIKNTSVTSSTKLYETYKWQVLYYMYFFGVPKAKLICFVNGWDFIVIDFTEDGHKEDLEMISNFIDTFINSLDNNTLPEEWDVVEEQEEKEIIDTIEVIENIKELNNIKVQMKELKTKETEIKNEIKASLGDNQVVPMDGKDYFYSTIIRKKVDWEKVARNLASKYGEDIAKEIEDNTSESKISTFKGVKNVK